MTKARVNADNASADIQGVTAGTGLSGGGTSGTVTLTNDMATTIDAKGDLVVGTGADTYVRVAVGSNNQVLTADSATTSGVKWATADALPSQTGNSGKYLTTDGTTASWGTVNQPIAWTPRRNADGKSIKGMTYNGSNLYVVFGGGGFLATSPDGITWTDRTPGFGTNNISQVSFGNGLWVAVGQNGTITTSTDGATWTARTSNMGTNFLYDVRYANSIWVVSGAGGGTTNTGGIAYSTDGVTWTRKSQSLTIGADYYAVTYNGTNWIICADQVTNNYAYASTPSGTWTVGAVAASTNLGKLFYDGTRTWAIRTNGNAYYTTSSTFASWTGVSNQTIQCAAAGNQNTFLFGTTFYQASQVYTTVSSVTSNAYMPDLRLYGFTPAITDANNGNIQGNANSILVTSAGIIIADGVGRVWTSF